MGPTAASRPGGKFASLSAKPRGKFANTDAPPTASSSSIGTGSTGTIRIDGTSSTSSPNENDTNKSRFKYYNERHNLANSTLTSKRKQLKKHSVFDDLDKAESLVLDLLSLSSSTADSLSQLAQPPPTLTSQEPQQNHLILQNSHDRNNQNIHNTNDELTERIRSNGKEYLSKLGRIYSLLEPRAHLVVSYGNLSPPTSSSSASASATVADNNKRDGEVKVNHNMYASRLEMRLAIERRDLMKELVRLEKQDGLNDDCDRATATAATSDNRIISVDTTTIITTPIITPGVDLKQPDASLMTTTTANVKRKREPDDQKT